MENIFYNDNFYLYLQELADYLGSEGDLEGSNDNVFEIELSQKEPIVELSPDWIIDRIESERWSENGCDQEMQQVEKALIECIDFEKLKTLMPQLSYGTNKMQKITTKELKELL